MAVRSDIAVDQMRRVTAKFKTGRPPRPGEPRSPSKRRCESIGSTSMIGPRAGPSPGRAVAFREAGVRKFLLVVLLLLAGSAVADAGELSRGQTVYVPVYSHVSHGNLDSSGKPWTLQLSVMLSIRNVNPDNAITVRAVTYYDTEGKKLREFYAEPKTLAPMQSTDVFVENKDMTGGSGANFLVVWDADRPVNAPIVEAVHAYFFGNQSLVFTTTGEAIEPVAK
jgi:hypothetical protein